MRLRGRVVLLCAAALLVAGCDLRPVTDQVSVIDTVAVPASVEGSARTSEDTIPHVVAEPIETDLPGSEPADAGADPRTAGANPNEHLPHADPTPPAAPRDRAPTAEAPSEVDDADATEAPTEGGSSADGDTPASTASEEGEARTQDPEPDVEPSGTAPPTAPAAAADGPEPSPEASVPLSAIERQIVDMLNAERSAAGLRPVRIDARLTHSARDWATTMARGGTFAHESEGGFSENIAYGYEDAAEVHEAWMASPGHRSNRMRAGLSSYGVGVRAAGTTLYFVERFR